MLQIAPNALARKDKDIDKDGVYVHPVSFRLIEGHSQLDSMKILDSIARKLLSHIVETLDNQSTAVNERLDSVNERLHRLIEVRDDLSTVNKSLVKLVEAQDKQTRAVNERLDKVIELLRATTLDKGNQPRAVNDTTVYSNSARKLYICHSIHENDRTYAENVCEFCDEVGISSTTIRSGVGW